MTQTVPDRMQPQLPLQRAPAASADVTVLYIMGLFRSGSTILDIILGNHDQVESVGELRSLAATGWMGSEVCSCGQPAASCEHWLAVRQRWQQLVGGDRVARLVELQNRFERIRSFPILFAASLVRTQAFREYARLTAALYAAIAEVSGISIIVDSTKYPGRALALSRMSGISLRLVHLVRDGRGVVWSVHRKANVDLEGNVVDIAPGSVAKTTTRQWLRVNLMSSLVAALGGVRSIRVRYEDFVVKPEHELARIGQLAGVDFSGLATRLVAGEPLHSGHMIAGNRVRHSGAIRLKPDLEWREKLPDDERRAFWKGAGWLARRYGYGK